MAAVRIDDKAFADARFELLAKLMKLPKADYAIIRVARICQMQTENYTPQRPTYVVSLDVIAAMLGPKGADHLKTCGLAEGDEEGLYMKGTKGRIEWLYTKRASASTAGIASGCARRAKSYREQTLNERSTDVQRSLNESSTDAQRNGNENSTHANALTLSLSPSSVSKETLKKRESASPPRTRAVAIAGEVKAQALELWAEQDKLRQEAIPGCRALKPADDQIARVAEAIRDYGVDDCRHVLAVYAAEAKLNPDSAKWFNGVSNWRTDNINRARGRALPTAKNGATRDIRFGSAPPSDFTGLTPGEQIL